MGTPELNIEELGLENVGNLAEQFRSALAQALAVVEEHRDGDLHETTKGGSLRFEATCKIQIVIDPADGSCWVESQMPPIKAPKRKARLQNALLRDKTLYVNLDQGPLPEQKPIRFDRKA